MNATTQKTKFYVGWDVGAWNCDTNRKSRDAIVILDSQAQVYGEPWGWSNLRKHINSASTTREWLECLFGLCKRTLPEVDYHITMAIDTPLGFSSELVSLASGLTTFPGQIEDSETNRYLFRQTERFLFAKGLTPLSAVLHMIGSQSTKGMHVLSKFSKQNTSCGVWTDGSTLDVIEAYPASCKKSDKVKQLRQHPPLEREDYEDALTCALVAYLYGNDRGSLTGPQENTPKNEGWIWVPADVLNLNEFNDEPSEGPRNEIANQSPMLNPPADITLPLFVYGALKPGMPAFERLRSLVVEPFQPDQVGGSLYVRDGLPLLFPNNHETLSGFLLKWKPGQASSGYEVVCQFEPPKHYQWTKLVLNSGTKANALTARYPTRGNPQPLHQSVWRIMDDPAFGSGLSTVREMYSQLPQTDHCDDWAAFFRAQMAYLLLWSILERLSALCFGPDHDPTKRAIKLHELPGMQELIVKHVTRTDHVSDSRDPSDSYKLNAANPKKCFQYYYQLRSNLSHRGKGVWKEFDKVKKSLEELLSITEDYLEQLRVAEIKA